MNLLSKSSLDADISQTSFAACSQASTFRGQIAGQLGKQMNKTYIMATALVTAGLAVITPAIEAQTLKKITETNKITVSYRESSVPFSYLISPKKAVGFSVDLTEAIVDDVRSKLRRPNLEVAYIPVTSQTRIPLLVNGTYVGIPDDRDRSFRRIVTDDSDLS